MNKPSIKKWYLTLWGILLVSSLIVWGLLLSSSTSLVSPELKTSVLDGIAPLESQKNEGLLWENIALNIEPETEPIIEEKLPSAPLVEDGVVLPSEVNLWVPFYSQAPDNDWNLPWSESCEEASLVLAYYFTKWLSLTKEEFKQEILNMIELEKKLLWKYISTNIEETATILKEYYHYDNFEVLHNPTLPQLQAELALWHPILVPLDGKKIGNSFYQNGWPKYHMLVIVGYKNGHFITNDVGTIRWEKFEYPFDAIMNSLQDLTENGDFEPSETKNKVLVLK